MDERTSLFLFVFFLLLRIPSLASCQRWSGPEKLLALDELIDCCEPPQIKHMMQVIEPQFQRDFISLLPKEVGSLFGRRPHTVPGVT